MISFQRIQKYFIYLFLNKGTGLQIPPAAKQALQMSGSIPFSNFPGGEDFVVFFHSLSSSSVNCFSSTD